MHTARLEQAGEKGGEERGSRGGEGVPGLAKIWLEREEESLGGRSGRGYGPGGKRGIKSQYISADKLGKRCAL